MQAETIKYAKHTQDRTGRTLTAHLSTLLTEPISPKNATKIHKIQKDLQTLEEEIIHNQLFNKQETA